VPRLLDPRHSPPKIAIITVMRSQFQSLKACNALMCRSKCLRSQV